MFRLAARCLLLIVIALPAPATAIAGERRVALVVGASAYKAVPALRNTLNDANGIAAALKRLDFEVETIPNPDRAAFEAGIRRFGTRARAADVALFFYAGHALESGGRNWLLPVSADVRGGRDLRFEAIDLDGILEQLEGAARLSVIILDSCRDNPFRMRLGEGGRGMDRGGLAQVQAAAGTLVVFSTAPGSVAEDGAGPNSPFTTALLRRIESPGLDVRQMLADVRKDVREATKGKQIPWEQSAMEGTLYLKPVLDGRGADAASPTPPNPGLDAEALFWDTVRNSTNRAEVQAYLNRFPNGVFADLARTRLAGLSGTEVALPQSLTQPRESPAPDRAARLIAARPISSSVKWTDAMRRYAEARQHKAVAVLPEQDGLYWSAEWASAEKAELITLEKCQLFHGEPCRPFARDDQVLQGIQPPRDMPRLHYAGSFQVAEIPILPERLRASPEVAGYAAAAAPKAMALHPAGFADVVVGAATQRAAEEQVLATCNAEPRRGQGGPCFLYAAGNQVLLAQRRTQPVTPLVPPRRSTADAPE